MQPAENKDYSRDVILRLSPTRNTIIVEEQKPGGIAAYREIDPLELYYVINQSYASNDYLDSGFLPEHCLHLSMSAAEKYFVLWNPELRADVIYGDKEYPNFPIPRMVFGVRVLENGKVAECSMGVVADEAPTVDMEEKIINMNQFLGAAQGDQEHMLGKFLYFSLANLLVDKDELSSLCESMGIPYTGSTRLSLGDAFRSATGDIRERVPVTVDGETNIYLAYCRDNKRTAGVFSRELVKETLNRETNRYEKLANISCGKNDGMFRCDNLVLDDAVDVQGCCRKAEELFELYQRCANRKQIETICVNFLRGMEATKLSVTGHMYFVPRTFMERVDIFEDFINLLSGLNKKQTPLVVNSFYIIDDAKQRDKMTEEFYLAVKKEIAAYQEKCDYLIKSSSQSPAVMERWVLKVQALEEKKRHYEGVLQRELDGLDDEFSFLKLLSQELQVRAKSIRSQRFQQRAA